ncbi:PAS domain-containing sensor histidine kinase [Natronomonas marina]|uniref:PAS domain-containing sensor histidine kinase n=1 Tax=Natronomonas marina TaxID=2961939 RepID=UPI0020CA238E|nr:PAS domain S-box protein [Natronomonas marina]
MSGAEGETTATTATTGNRLRGWSVVAVGLALLALPVGLAGLQRTTGLVTMAPPVLAAGGIVATGVALRRRQYTPGDVAIIAAWIAASAVVFAVVIAITVATLVDDPVSLGAFATAFMAPIGACGGLVAGYTDARRRRQHRRGRRTRQALQEATDGVAVVDGDEFGTVNRAHVEMHGHDNPDAMVGRSWETCYPDHERRRLEAEALPKLAGGDAWRGEATGKRADGTTFPQELTLSPIEDGGFVCIVRDISDRRERERRLRRQTRRLRTVVENAPIILLTVDDEGDIVFIEGQGLSQFGIESETLEGVSVFELGIESEGVASTARRALEGESGHATVRIGDRVLKAWFSPVFDAGEVDRVIGATMDITDRHERERRLTELHEASRRLTYATTRTEVAETTVDIAEEILDKPVSVLWHYEAERDRHRPAAMTDDAAVRLGIDRVEELATISGGDPAMEAFREGDPRHIDEGSPFDADLGTVVAVPLGSQGLLVVGQRDPEPLAEAFRQRAGILGLNAGAALDRSDREELLRERTEELRTRASQMEFVNGIIRHDVLNGMTVVRSRASYLEDQLEGRNREHAETVVEWADNITGLVDRVRTVLSTLGDEESADLEVVDVADLLREEFGRLERTYPEVTFESDLPETVPVRADDVLADVLQNVVTNAIEHNDPEGLVVSVSAEVDDDRATVRIADDGVGIPPDRQDAVLRRGESRTEAADSGFGLFFVDAMVEAYDGDVRIENDDGAVVVLELPAADAPAERPTVGRGEGG